MTDAPVSPRAGRLATPSWLDTRLVLGVLLVLVSVVVGARLLSTADRSQLVWMAGTDLAAGSSLTEGDLQPAQVRLFDRRDAYLPATAAPPVGYVLDRPVAAGELLPRQALSRPGEDVDLRLVTVPVLPGHYPPELRNGQQVDVWSTPAPNAVAAPAPADDADGAGGAGGAARLVLPGLTVQSVPDQGGGLSGATPERAVVLVVPPEDVESLLSAMASGRVDLVRVPTGDDARELAPAAEDG